MADVTQSSGTPVAPAAAVAVAESEGSYVDWPAVFAGAVVAAAIAFVLQTFGLALGLTLTSPLEGEGVGATGLIIGVGLWMLWVTVSSFMAGAYLTGRLRRRLNDASENEVDIRDGAHGLIMWALGVLVGALLLVSGALGAVGAVGSLVGTGATAATEAVAAADTDDLASIADTLFRTDRVSDIGDSRAATGEARRLLAGGQDVSDEDSAYLTRLVADATGLSAEDARARVDAALQEIEQLEDEAREAAEAARKASIISAFVVAASLLIAAAGAYWAAGLGGRHRDENVAFKHFGRWL